MSKIRIDVTKLKLNQLTQLADMLITIRSKLNKSGLDLCVKKRKKNKNA
jgi:hypothetical protein